MSLSNEALEYIDAHREEELQLLKDLARIPAPSNHEEKRAEFCKNWLEKQGAKGVYIDGAQDVVYPVGCTDSNPLVVFMAHSDVVFPDTEELPLTVADGEIRCPGVGDDSANVAALLLAAKYITEKGLKPSGFGMLIVVNSGEEGLGNLRGSRRITADFGKRITAFFSLDGSDGHVTDCSVGSKRYKVEVLTEGGHSYGRFGNRNAIAYLASMIDALYTMKVPDGGKTTYNVGVIKGGTSVNSIAQQAEMLYEFRSDRRESLDIMEEHFNRAVDFYRTKGITVNVTLVGDRPCMGNVDPDKHKALLEKAGAAVREYFGIEPRYGSGSTDCNIPLSEGIPAACVGCYVGGGAHTRSEFVRIDSLVPGVRLAFDLMLGYMG